MRMEVFKEIGLKESTQSLGHDSAGAVRGGKAAREKSSMSMRTKWLASFAGLFVLVWLFSSGNYVKDAVSFLSCERSRGSMGDNT